MQGGSRRRAKRSHRDKMLRMTTRVAGATPDYESGGQEFESLRARQLYGDLFENCKLGTQASFARGPTGDANNLRADVPAKCASVPV